MNNKFAEIISFAMLVESLITYSKEFFAGNNFSFSMVLSILLGITISIAYKLDLPKYSNLKSNIPYVGNILTGVLISRGSNYLYDILKVLTSIK